MKARIFYRNAYFWRASFVAGAAFESASFSHADFTSATFFYRASFSNAQFDGGATFASASFSVSAIFAGATFSSHAFFTNVTFSGDVAFENATFVWANFKNASFSLLANFENTSFSHRADFTKAVFSGGVGFWGAIFRSVTTFGGASFVSPAMFEHAIFSDETFFIKSIFCGQTSFVNAEMKAETSFEGAVYGKEPPRFFGAKLHQGTVWRGITWPPLPKNKDEAGAFIDAYACLKLEMDRLKKHEDELDFFALELQSRRVILGSWRGFPVALYGALSDYGRSYLRPLVALFYLSQIGTFAFLPSDSLSPLQSLGISAANTLNVFGFRKDFFDAATIEGLPAEGLPALLKILAAGQTILGTILLFLFGLGVRNKFRMK